MMTPRCVFAPDAEPGQPAPKFEELLTRLETIVSDMENGEMPLDQLLSQYEEGMRLVKACGDKLSDAEQKVEVLSKAMETAATSNTPGETKPAAPESDIRLF